MMGVWDPKDKPAVFSRIKTFIEAHTEGFSVSRYLYYPGKWLYEWFLKVCENYGSDISNWAWHKRWIKGIRRKWKED